MKSETLVSAIFVSLLVEVQASLRTCASLDNFPLIKGKDINHLEIDVIKHSGLVTCAANCKLRKVCKSFSFRHDDGLCKLFKFAVIRTSNNVVDAAGVDVSNIQNWPSRIAGPCATHSCSDLQVCHPTSDYSKKCVTTYCPIPVPVDHGRANFQLTYETTKVGSYLPYICAPNFRPAGTRICLSDGTWSEFKCQAVCPLPPVVPNAETLFVTDTNLDTTEGVVLSYTCHKYYEPFGVMKCQNDATWSIFGCDRSNCPLPPPSVENADLVTNPNGDPNGDPMDIDSRIGAVITYKCNVNYQPVGEMRCDSDGNWTGFACELVCPLPPVVPNADPMFVTDTNLNTSVGVVLSYTCHKYYEPFGEMMCQNDATWSIFGCDRSNCPLPPPRIANADLVTNPNGDPNGDPLDIDSRIGAVITYECNVNYRPVGEMRCDSDGNWTGFACELACPLPPVVPNANPQFVTDNNLNTSVGVVLSYTCHKYYRPVGAMKCHSNAKWSTFVCERSNCPLPPPPVANADLVTDPNGDPIDIDSRIGAVITYKCNVNYRPVGQMRCDSDGNWTSFACELDSICPWSTYFDLARVKCYLLSTERVVWKQAIDKCSKIGYLTDIETQEDYTFIRSFVNNGVSYWVGFSDDDTEGSWVWVNTEFPLASDYQEWDIGQPDGDTSENCAIWNTPSGKLHDKPCKDPSYGFICQAYPVKCVMPPVIVEADPNFDFASFNRSIGVELTYTCQDPGTAKTITITCLQGGTWEVAETC